MSVFQKRRWLVEFGLVCLVPILLIGVFLLQTLKQNVKSRAVANATEQARLVTQVGLAGQLAGTEDLHEGLSGQQIAALDSQLETMRAGNGVGRVVLRDRSGKTVYSDDHSLVGRRTAPPAAASALDGDIVSDVGTAPGAGRVLQVFVPLKVGAGPAAGSAELSL